MKKGDYVRDVYGEIGRITKVLKTPNKKYYYIDNSNIPYTYDRFINSSTNIIDLLEVGDIVSFKDDSICRIMEITDDEYYLIVVYGDDRFYVRKEYLDDLVSVLTHEQYEREVYKV